MRVDSHQHFWRYSAAEYPWMKPGWPIRKDFLPADLRPILNDSELDGSVAVQARQSLDESRWLLKLADVNRRILGVVGWVDLHSPQLDQQLAELASHPRFRGVRHVVQDEPDDFFMLQPEFLRGIEALKPYDLTYDLLIFPNQLPAAIELAERFPAQPLVLDHIAKPAIRDRGWDEWASGIRDLAQCPSVYCKISGMVTEAHWGRWNQRDFSRYLDLVAEAFGPSRLMFGSDWPVCLLSASYAQVVRIVEIHFSGLSIEESAGLWGENARKFYHLGKYNPGSEFEEAGDE